MKPCKRTITISIILLIVALVAGVGIYRSTHYIGVINSMDRQELIVELERLPEIGDILSVRIADLRPYESWDDLETRVDGVGEMRIRIIKKHFSID